MESYPGTAARAFRLGIDTVMRNIELIEKKKDEGLFHSVTYHRHIKPIGNSRIAQMIPHTPNVVVPSWSPFAHWASTERELSEFSTSEEKGCLRLSRYSWPSLASRC